MTAIVGVLNKHGVAFAADSAATRKFCNEYRVNYHANKIFSLSKYHPVGICIYNTLSFEGVPWETIFKMYRAELKDKKFDTLRGYIDNFWTFVKKSILPNVIAEQNSYFETMTTQYWEQIKSLGLKDVGGVINNTNIKQYYDCIIKQLGDMQKAYSTNRCIDFVDYNTKKFEKYGGAFVKQLLASEISDCNCPKDLPQKFMCSLYNLITNQSLVFYPKDDYSGIVFWGYGDKDLFPSYLEFKVTHAFDKHVKYWQLDNYSIDNRHNACIAPFAQTDVTNTFIRSVDGKLRQEFIDSSKQLLSDFRDEIVESLKQASAPQQLLDLLNAIDCNKYKKKYSDAMAKYINEHYIDNLIETVAYLSKEDLSDMAENLVRMTCLKRHITSELESVGGPVDVAVITKGDGFIWIKRKHYFEASLNQQFFERYNK